MKEKRLEILRKLANNKLTPEMADEQLLGLRIEGSRYFGEKFTPPFRVGRKQQRIVLDSDGLEVAHFHFADENMADDYVIWLNGC
jgi:hypothetical protein